MAGPWFVRSGAGGAGTGADWANAFTTLTAANTASTAGGGETFWIADDHAESTAGAVTLTSKGVVGNPNFYYCVDHTVASPGTGDLKTTGQITTTGNNGVALAGAFYFYGMIFNGGSGAVAAGVTMTATWGKFDTCALNKLGTAVNTNIAWTHTYVELVSTTLQFGNTGDRIRVTNALLWRKGGSVTGTPPTAIFDTQNVTPVIIIDGVDLSALATNVFAAGIAPGVFSVTRCKLNATVAFPTPTAPGQITNAVQSDSAASSVRQQSVTYQGSLAQETTIVRSGGASDGTTPISWKLVSTANSKWVLPFESFPIPIWNDTVGSSVTATVEIVAAGALNNDDVWMEVEYFGSSATPVASFANSTKANNLATGSALTSSAASWASSPGNAQKMSVTFTPQMAGDIVVRVYVAKASQTLYVDPYVTLSPLPTSASRQRILVGGVYVNDFSGTAGPGVGFQPIEEGLAA